MGKFCTNCGREMKEEDLFCEACGTRASEHTQKTTGVSCKNEHPVEQSLNQSMPKVKPRKKKSGCLIVFLIIIGVCAIIGIGMRNERIVGSAANDAATTKDASPIFNANEYSRISSNELMEKMGAPSAKDDWVNKTVSGEFPVTTYEYDTNGVHYEFIIADDKVVRVSIYSNQYWNREGDFFVYDSKSDFLTLFGITELSDNAKISDSNVAYRISSVSDVVADFWVVDIDNKSKTFGLVKITYNINYFE